MIADGGGSTISKFADGVSPGAPRQPPDENALGGGHELLLNY